MPMTLCEALQGADLLLIDDLHAWQFHYAPSGEPALRIDCQDGSQARHWQFNQAELAAAQYDPGEIAGGLAAIACNAWAHSLATISTVRKAATAAPETGKTPASIYS